MFKEFLILLCSCIFTVSSTRLPFLLDASENKTTNVEFSVHLPNNDTVQVDLSFKLFEANSNENSDENSEENRIDKRNLNLLTTTTTSTTLAPSSGNKPLDDEYVSPEYAIEAFRQELIRKESDIAGIIQSDKPFYRHFKLEFSDELSLTIRCTYYSDFNNKILNISCYEYREYAKETYLANGEIEYIREFDTSYKSKVQSLNLRRMKQTYKMEIS